MMKYSCAEGCAWDLELQSRKRRGNPGQRGRGAGAPEVGRAGGASLQREAWVPRSEQSHQVYSVPERML